jgi:hypothetical protein
MTKRNRLHHRSIIVAAATATFMMFVFGAAHRTLTARLTSPADASSMSPDALEKLPLQISQWTGQEEPLDEAVIEATDTDAHISRRYCRYNALEQVWLYIAAGKRARDLMPHRPEVCYTGAGWTRINNNPMELLLDDGTALPCSVFQFTKGVLNTKKVVVLDYYIVDGRFCRDISLLRSKIWRGSGSVDYVVQVQIVANITADQTADSTEKMVCAFACESASSIFQILEGIAKAEEPNT